MGQPKLPKKKFDTPNHPWQGDRIKAEHEVKKKYGLKSKTEIWKAQSELRSVRGQARNLVSRGRNPDDHQAHQEAKQLLQRLHRRGYVGADATLNDVLALDVERILGRRLQSQVYLKGLARTPRQARQFVSHGLIMVGDRRVTVPSYVVRREEEEIIQIRPEASISNPDHPVRPKAPGAEVTTAVRDAPATAEEPTGSAPPPQAEATPTVAPSEGERADDAAREAAPGEHPPAGEAVQTEPAEAPATETPDVAKEAEGAAAVTETETAKEADASEAKAEEPKAEEPKAEEPKAEEPEAKEAKAEESEKADEGAENKEGEA